MRKYVSLLLVLWPLAPGNGARASDEVLKVEEAEEAIGFITGASVYHGYLDSIVDFCKPHVPEFLVAQTLKEWHAEYDSVLKLRDREVRRLVALARQRGAPPENIVALEAMPKDAYESPRSNERWMGDLKKETELLKPCAKRLGNLLSDGMKLSKISPDTWAYYLEKRGT